MVRGEGGGWGGGEEEVRRNGSEAMQKVREGELRGLLKAFSQTHEMQANNGCQHAIFMNVADASGESEVCAAKGPFLAAQFRQGVGLEETKNSRRVLPAWRGALVGSRRIRRHRGESRRSVRGPVVCRLKAALQLGLCFRGRGSQRSKPGSKQLPEELVVYDYSNLPEKIGLLDKGEEAPRIADRLRAAVTVKQTAEDWGRNLTCLRARDTS